MHFAAADAGGIAGADDRADRRAGDGGRLHAELVEDLADEDVRHAPGAATPQGKTDTRTQADMTRPFARECGGGMLAAQVKFRP